METNHVTAGRVCEIYAETDAQEGLSCGSGFLVTDRLVLTAAHVVRPGTPVQARFLTDGGALVGYEASVIWSRHDQTVDAALLEIRDPRWTGSSLPPPRWGRLVGAGADVGCQAVGFPDLRVSGPDGMREWKHLSGRINLLDLRKTGRLEVAVDHPPAPVADAERSPWAGMSGAALFVNSLLVGVVVQDSPGHRGGRLTAVRTERFASDLGFAEQVWGKQGRAWPYLRPAELAPLHDMEPDTAMAAIPPGAPPTRMLAPRWQAVPFLGREEVLDRLRDWCDDTGQRVSMRLLTGPGGQGKTRLAQELSWRASHAGWATIHLRPSTSERPLDYAVLASLLVPLLVVVDFAEGRAEQIKALTACLPESVPVRLLLVARTHSEWISDLNAEHLQDALSTLVEERLGPLAQTMQERHTLFSAAVTAFTSARPALAQAGPPGPSGGMKMPKLTGPRYGNALAVQMTALAALLEAAEGRTMAPGRSVADVVLAHEASHWESRAERLPGLAGIPHTRRKALVTVATTCTAASRPDALRVTGAFPDLADQKNAVQSAAAQWIHELYGDADRYWSTLQPDMLHEHLVGTVLAGEVTLLDQVAPKLDHQQACAMLTVLVHAAEDHTHLKHLITRLIVRHPAQLGLAAVHVALQVRMPAPLLKALDTVARRCPDPVVLQQLMEAIPSTSRLLKSLRQRLTAVNASHTPSEGSGEMLSTGAASRTPLAGTLSAPAGATADNGPLSRLKTALVQLITAAKVNPVTRSLGLAPNAAGELSNTLTQHGAAVATGVGALTLMLIALLGGPEAPHRDPAAQEASPTPRASNPYQDPLPTTAPTPQAEPTESAASTGTPSGTSSPVSRDGSPLVPNPPRHEPAGQPAWGYAASAEQEHNSPIGTDFELNWRHQWGTWKQGPATVSGRNATARRTADGRYLVRFPGLGQAHGVTHATAAYKEGSYTGPSCQLLSDARPDGADQLAEVACFSPAGQPANERFAVVFAGHSAAASPAAAAVHYRPGAVAGTYNSAGGPIEIARLGTGRYNVSITGTAYNALGHTHITAVGATPAQCRQSKATRTTGGMVLEVACHLASIGPSATPADTGWNLSYSQNAGLNRQPSVAAAYLATAGDPAQPSIDSQRSWSFNDETPTVSRAAAGRYVVHYERLAATLPVYPTGHVQLAATGPNPRYCFAQWWNSYSTPPKLRIDVWCFDHAGRYSDAEFALTYVRAP